MIRDHDIFDTRAPADFLELGPYEVERIRFRRGRPAQVVRDHLTGDEIGMLAVAGAAVGTAIAFIVDAHGAAAALLSIVGL